MDCFYTGRVRIGSGTSDSGSVQAPRTKQYHTRSRNYLIACSLFVQFWTLSGQSTHLKSVIEQFIIIL